MKIVSWKREETVTPNRAHQHGDYRIVIIETVRISDGDRTIDAWRNFMIGVHSSGRTEPAWSSWSLHFLRERKNADLLEAHYRPRVEAIANHLSSLPTVQERLQCAMREHD